MPLLAATIACGLREKKPKSNKKCKSFKCACKQNYCFHWLVQCIRFHINKNTEINVLTIAITGIKTPRLPALLDACKQQYHSEITQQRKTTTTSIDKATLMTNRD